MFYPQPSRHARFRQTRVLIVGCGDVGLRAARLLVPHCRVLALSSTPARLAGLRAAGVVPLLGNLDEAASLRRLRGLATHVLHLAPPPSQGAADPRTAHLLRALSRGGQVASLVYGSTTGVYGDTQGAQFDETRAVAPATDRARRRVDAEARVRAWGCTHVHGHGGDGHGQAGGPRATHTTRASILRIPGIYALNREGGDPRERVRKGSPVLTPADDVYTNHIHADDLARACVAALWRGRPGRIVHACDDTDLRMGDYFDWVADHFGLPRPPRLSREEARAVLSPMQMSFMGESRRLHNGRLKAELRVALRYPTIQAGLA